MNTDKVICPNCKTEIPITEALQNQIEEKIRTEFESKWEQRDSVLKEREELASKRERDLVIERQSFEEVVKNQVKESLEKERQILQAKIRVEEREKVDLDVQSLKAQQKEQQEILIGYKSKVLESQKKERETKQVLETMEIKYQEKFSEEKEKVTKILSEKMDGKYRLQLADKDKTISDMTLQLQETTKKLEQGSQQLQGEVLELELEQILKANFPHDNILPVPKGIKGADVLQKIITTRGESCGTIIWESKRTKSWSDSWIKKLKEDQLEQKADLAVLYSSVLPKGIKNFAVDDGVWITNHDSLLVIATALRFGLINVARTKTTTIGKNQKKEVLYAYLTGNEFAQRVGIFLQTHIEMKAQLDQERRAMNKIWSKREKQIESVQINLSSIWGGLQGIIGASLPELEALSLLALPEASSDSDEVKPDDHSDLPF